MTTVAIMQPTYLPWCGYWDMLDQADVFVLLDTVAVDRKSWQTRNTIRARDGQTVWLSVPVHAHQGERLDEVRMADNGWPMKHMRTLDAAYRHAPYWTTVAALMCDVIPWANGRLASYTSALAVATAMRLGIRPDTDIVRASAMSLPTRADPIHRIADICTAVGATELLNTPGARDFLEGHDIGVPVRWHDYEHPVYDQGGAEWVSHLSVVDLLAWHGPDSLRIIRSGRKG